FATVLLILVVGKACNHAERSSKLDKVYDATVILGKTSSTGGPECEIRLVASPQSAISSEKRRKVLEQLTGEIEQTPPIYSAIKIGGQRAYKLARAGKAVTMPKRSVTIYSIEIISYQYPELKIRAHVASGTYIRTLAEDIGAQLGVGGYCAELRRTQIRYYKVSDAVDFKIVQ
ncbi:MAG: hypothetical protein ACR2KZ_11755, partial [Segetibacter sp.]